VLDSASPLGIGPHGHQALSDPLTVTCADHNAVREIDGRPAWQVWPRHRARIPGIDPDTLNRPSEIFDWLNRFEAGLSVGES